MTTTHRDVETLALNEYPLAPTLAGTLGERPSPAFEATRVQRLRAALERALALPFYRDLYAGIDLHPRDVQHVEDLRQLPVFDVHDIRDSTESAPPLGRHQNPAEAARFQFSGGTTGMPRPVAYTYWDRVLGDVMHARCLQMHGVGVEDVVVNSMAYGPHNAAIAFDGAMHRHVGCTVLPLSTGHVTSSSKQVDMMRAYGATHVIASADYLVHLASVARGKGLDPQHDFALRGFTTIGDVKAAEQAWGLPAWSCYGTFELQMCATECSDRSGWHLWEDAYAAWVRDPSSGEEVAPGAPGELIATSLWSQGFPVINMNTRDMTALGAPAPCSCGLWFSKLAGFLGRSDSMIKVRGINVWPEAVGPVLADALRGPAEFLCAATRSKGRDELTVFLESTSPDAPDLAGKALKERLGVAVDVRAVAPGVLGRLTGRDEASKTRRFIDRRDQDSLQLAADGAPL